MSIAKPALLLLFAALLADAQFISVGGNGQPGYNPTNPVQQIQCAYSSGSSYTCTLSTPPSAGHILIAVVGQINASTLNSATAASSGAAWSNKSTELSPTPPGAVVDILCATLTGTPSQAVTISLTSSATSSYANVSEWATASGACTGNPLTNAIARSNTTVIAPGSSLSPTVAAIVFAVYAFATSGSSLTSGPTGGFTALNVTGGGSNNLFQAAYQVVPAGTYTTSWTVAASNNWVTVMKSIAQ